MDENAAGATITAVSTENATETTVDNDHFEVVDGNLKLKADSSLDFEAIEGGMLDVVITASGDGESANHTVTITVNDVNEAPSIEVADGETPDGMPASSTVDENVAGAILGAITLSDPDAGQMHTLTTSDDRFVTKQDAEGGWWLALADGVSLDHEAGATVMVTVTVTDDGDPAMSASTDVTITVNDVNEAPTAVGKVETVTAAAGKAIEAKPIDLLALFSDPDDGDAPVRYELSGNPEWLKFSVEYGEDDDGNDTAHGIFTGTPKPGTDDSDAAHKVTLTATDGDGESGSASFYVVVDDGNDAVTSVELLDNNGNVTVEVEVDENDASGVVLGEIRVNDIDHPMHPNGMHHIEVDKANAGNFEIKYDDAGIPWLVLREGKSLDHEKATNGAVDVTITATDFSSTDKTGKATGSNENVTITVVVHDKNDAPKANTIGNWWVTVEDDLKSDEVGMGDWLSFGLETGTASTDKPAFTDPDRGDTLTYSLSGPDWLEIHKTSGAITNTKGGLPERGVHRVTVTATDPDGASAEATFHLAVAFSDDGDNYTEGNHVPEIDTDDGEYVEGSGDQTVATFTVKDEDHGLGHHPFALNPKSVEIVSVVDSNGAERNAAGQSYASTFRLSDPTINGDTWTYSVNVRNTSKIPMVDTRDVLDHEGEDNGLTLTITVRAHDGVDGDGDGSPDWVTETLEVEIEDANEAPKAANIGNDNTFDQETYDIDQSEDEKVVVYIKLEDLWTDPEGDDPDDLTYGLTVSGGWISILSGPGEWGDIKEGRDGRDDTPDDVPWATEAEANTPTQNPVVIGGDDEEPGPRELVAIIEIDRTGRNNGQGDEGSFTITATDDDGATGRKVYKVTPNDVNEPLGSDAVSLTGSAREDATLRVHFDETKDPDLAGSASPVLVLYTWSRLAETADDTDLGTVFMVTTSDAPYKLTQDDVGFKIKVTASYYEVFGNAIVNPTDTSMGFDVTDRKVTNTPDAGTGTFTITTGADSVTAVVNVRDEDHGGAVDAGDISFSWQMSANGRGGWAPVDGANTDTLTLDDGEGRYYRAVATYDADGDPDTDGDESVYSDSIRFGDIRDAAPAPAAEVTGSAAPGGTLTVSGQGVSSVQWQIQRGGPTAPWSDIPGATGSLRPTADHVSASVRALVTYESTDSQEPGVTYIAPTPPQVVAGTTTSVRPVPVTKADFEASASGAPGHTVSVTETVNLASLFQDPDSSRLSFPTVEAATSNLGTDTETGDPNTYVFHSGPGILVFEVDGHSGKLTYVSDVAHGHDGDSTDGSDGGMNVLTLNITANDNPGGGNSDETAQVNLRINVSPTGISFEDINSSDVITTTGSTVSLSEHTGIGKAPKGGLPIVKVDVQDENAISHKFGMHTVTISGDDRFEITNTGNGKEDGDEANERPDASTWEVRLKEGEALDYETQADMDNNPANGKQIVLTLMATDDGGLSTPSGPRTTPIQLVITVTNAPEGSEPTPENVPGLVDDDSETDDDDRRDTTEDGDADGGSPPPPPGMSIGFIEDFVENMNGFDQDLLEDFMLIIDDGIDIA